MQKDDYTKELYKNKKIIQRINYMKKGLYKENMI